MRHGLAAEKVAAGYGEGGRIRAELYFSAENAPDSTIRVCDLISDELGIHLENAGQVSALRQVRICLYEPSALMLEVYGASSCADESSESGDTSAVFYDGAGAGYVVLSDGMGSGKEAAVESRMAVRLFRRLICSGADVPSSVRLINSVMLTKSRSELFATLDAVRISPDGSCVTVIKSGAAATLINSGGTLRKISAPTFPIGIYEQSEVYISEYTVASGDMIIMFSDGVCENEYPFIRELLSGGGDLKHIVDEICAKAEVFNPSVRADDVTVIGILVNRR
jgi:stage II sporulation protein E